MTTGESPAKELNLPARERTGTWLACSLLIASCGLLFGYRLTDTAFRGLYDDVDRALIARNMVDSGNWLIPYYHDRSLYTKPPLMYWLAAAAYRLSGSRAEWPAAMVSALCSLMVVLCTFWSGRILFGRRAGLLAALFLATAYLFIAMARQPLIDSVMMAGWALTCGAYIQLAFGRNRHRTLWWALVFLGLAIASLTKGPVVFPLLAILTIPLWWRRPRCLPSGGQLALGALLLAGLLIPWHWIVLRAAPEAWEVWKVELLGRFGQGEQFHPWTQQAWWFYLPDLSNFLPWLVLLPVALVHAIRRREERRFQLLLWWALGGFILFTLSSATKRSYYLLPLYPALALLCSAVVDAAARTGLHPSAAPEARALPRRLFHWSMNLTTWLVAGLGFAILLLPWLCRPLPAWIFLPGGIVVLLAVGGSWRETRRRHAARAAGWLVAAVSLIHLIYWGQVVPPVNDYISARPFYREAAPHLRSGRFTLYHQHRSLAAFYVGRQDIKVLHPDTFGEVAASGLGGWLVTDPHHVKGYSVLDSVLIHTLHSPFGERRRMGLYRLPTVGTE